MQKTIDKMICLARGEIIVDFYIIFQISYQIPVSSEGECCLDSMPGTA